MSDKNQISKEELDYLLKNNKDLSKVEKMIYRFRNKDKRKLKKLRELLGLH